MEVHLHAFLTLAVDGNDWSASCPRHIALENESPVPTGWASVLDMAAVSKICAPAWK